ncbi:uracil-DNA glycosylase [Ideonella livida]|uniref:Uracil-DNA glycosylase n=1 Tax=Ideonella livida TaxID=2707176 RepID=A0A7C9TJD0_9BURK|nr:uracil-DNA glycosylase [Ideonella livida]
MRPLDELIEGLPPDWRPEVATWRQSPAGQSLARFLAARQAAGATIYPADPFRALRHTPLAAVRAVILGQDPYHGPGQAEGLAFSVPPGLALPPSLRNLYTELERDLPGTLPAPPSRCPGHLGAWAARGVLLLNTSLTVEAGQPASHARQGWEALTDALIQAVSSQPQRIAFLLWGAHAQSRRQYVSHPDRHLVLEANHPSPLSARRGPTPFMGCGHFGQVQRELGLSWRLQEH